MIQRKARLHVAYLRPLLNALHRLNADDAWQIVGHPDAEHVDVLLDFHVLSREPMPVGYKLTEKSTGTVILEWLS